MKTNKKQILFLICMAILLVAVAIAVLFFGKKEGGISTDFQEGEGDIIVYDGKQYKYNEHLSNFIFLGVDTREKVQEYNTKEGVGQADAIFLVSLNRKEKTMQVLTIPRDTMTAIRIIGLDGEDAGVTKNHINLQYAFGDGKSKSCQLMKEAVSNLLYDLPIQGYCSMNMDGIPIATKTVGGVQVVVPNNTLEAVNPQFKEGAEVTITEENAEQFVRHRDINISQSALSRTERQMAFLEAFAAKVKKIANKDKDFAITLLESVEDYVVTNIGTDMYVKLMEASYEKDDVHTIPGEGVEGESFDEYHVDEDRLYELVLQMFYKEVQGK